jgi:hypothetical protein
MDRITGVGANYLGLAQQMNSGLRLALIVVTVVIIMFLLYKNRTWLLAELEKFSFSAALDDLAMFTRGLTWSGTAPGQDFTVGGMAAVPVSLACSLVVGLVAYLAFPDPHPLTTNRCPVAFISFVLSGLMIDCFIAYLFKRRRADLRKEGEEVEETNLPIKPET